MPAARPCEELDRPRPRYIALNTWIDDEIELENISEQGLRNRLHVGPVEIHLDAVALEKCGRLQRGRPHIRIAIALRIWCHVRARKQKWLRRSFRPAGICLVRDWKARAEISVATESIASTGATPAAGVNSTFHSRPMRGRSRLRRRPWKLNQTPPMQATHYNYSSRGAP